MKKRPSDRDVADDIVRLLNSEEDKRHHPDMNVRSLLERARDAGQSPLRMEYMKEAQRELAKLDHRRHGALITQLQAEILALQGRGGDTRVAHVTPGEIVIPERLQTPELLAALQAAAREQGIDPSRLVIGSLQNSINPKTGQPEFQDSSNPHEFNWDGPFGPGTMPPNRLQEWIQPWIGDKNVMRSLSSEQVTGMNNNLLGNYDRANGVVRGADKALRAIGLYGLSRLPPPADNVPIADDMIRTPFDGNKTLLDSELERRRRLGLLK